MFRSPFFTALLLLTLAVLTAANPLCDPETQYLSKGECCQMCKPGTSMVSMGVCRNPVCKDCDEDEYMDKYNTEAKCTRQPYCDPNSNFKKPEGTSTTVRHQCLCKEGFHCSSAACFTCVPHTKCGPGYGATTIGDHSHDTVCKECPEGTFSDETSWNGTCQEATRCLDRVEVSQDGSSVSDNKCVPKHLHVGVIAPLVLIGLAALVLALAFYKYNKYKGKSGHELVQTHPTEHVDDFSDNNKPPIEESTTIIASPTEDIEEFTFYSQESHRSVPEESEDVPRTANGAVLSQDGKEYVMSQPETEAIAIY